MWLFDWLLGKKPEVARVAGDVITDRKFFPLCVQRFDVLKGISIGQCIEPKLKILPSTYAHAHDQKHETHYGWICLKDAGVLQEEGCLLHEVAHLIVALPYSMPGHGKEWRDALVEIGGNFKQYRRKNGSYTVDMTNIHTIDDEKAMLARVAEMWNLRA